MNSVIRPLNGAAKVAPRILTRSDVRPALLDGCLSIQKNFLCNLTCGTLGRQGTVNSSEGAFVAKRLGELVQEHGASAGSAYTSCFFRKRAPTGFGDAAAKFCRQIYSNILFPDSPEPRDAERGECINGAARGANQTSCDFMSGNTRIEVKSSRLHNIANSKWGFHWYGVKLGKFDKLLLVGFTPKNMLVWDWDHKTYYSSWGVPTWASGGIIQIRSSTKCATWETALLDIQHKCKWSLLHTCPSLNLPKVNYTRTESAYSKSPLFFFSPSRRGSLMSQLCRDLYSSYLFPQAIPPVDAPLGMCIDGRKRGKNNTACDFVSWSTRVEVKSSILAHDVTQDNWGFRWHAVKCREFDQLLLLGITPSELLIWEWNGSCGLSSAGVCTSTKGKQICRHGRQHQHWRQALDHIILNSPGRLLLNVKLGADESHQGCVLNVGNLSETRGDCVIDR